MRDTDLDHKNVALSKLIFRLRQSLDVYRIIGLNAQAAARESGQNVSQAFFGYVQVVAFDSVVLGISKIFEWQNPKGHKLNSISGVVALLERHPHTALEKKAVERFGQRFGNTAECVDPTSFLRETIKAFKEGHKSALEIIEQHRHSHVAHSEFDYKIESLPSLDQFEIFFEFALEFYRMISESFVEVGPALFHLAAGDGLIRTFKQLGIENPKFNFPSESH